MLTVLTPSLVNGGGTNIEYGLGEINDPEEVQQVVNQLGNSQGIVENGPAVIELEDFTDENDAKGNDSSEVVMKRQSTMTSE